MQNFCAVCTKTITGTVYREPIGPNDAVVSVCRPCATEEVKPIECSVDRRVRREPTTDRAAAIREHRAELTSRGLCMYGERHGRATHGKLCEACRDRQRGRDVGRRRGANSARAQ